MKIDRQEVYNKFNGLCGYSGTLLEDDWQIDHIIPRRKAYLFNGDIDHISNLIPCQKIINHYKRALDLETFRGIWLGGLHKRLEKPKNPRTEKSRKTKEYRQKIAAYFNIEPDAPFDGLFYFEKIRDNIK